MRKDRKRTLLILIAMLAILCLVFTGCRTRSSEDKTEPAEAAVTEQKEEASQAEEKQKDKTEKDKSADKKSEDTTADDQAADSQDKEKTDSSEAAKKKDESSKKSSKDSSKKSSKDSSKKSSKKSSKDSSKKSSKKSSSKKSNKSSSSSKSSEKTEQPKEKEKVWVPPVTETRTVTLDTGTRYCNGANSNGGCGASWHGSKDSTYNSWHKHWQDYVKRRTAEEADKGNVYVCDHIHDDSRWVPDTTTEEVVIQEGYWKEVD